MDIAADPKLVIDVANQAVDLFRRDYLVASVVALLGINGIWAFALRQVLRRAWAVDDARVQDHKDGEARFTALVERQAKTIERGSETGVRVLGAVDLLLTVKGKKAPPPPAVTEEALK